MQRKRTSTTSFPTVTTESLLGLLLYFLPITGEWLIPLYVYLEKQEPLFTCSIAHREDAI